MVYVSDTSILLIQLGESFTDGKYRERLKTHTIFSPFKPAFFLSLCECRGRPKNLPDNISFVPVKRIIMNPNQFFLSFILALSTLSLTAQNKIAPTKPKLVVGIVVDNLNPEFIEKYGSYFDPNGFLKLAAEGTQIRHLRYDYHSRQILPTLASIVTGANPAQHGIIADEWYDRLSQQTRAACSDANYSGIGNTAYSGNWSPNNMAIPGVFDELKLFTELQSKLISIAPEAPAAITMGAHTADFSFWFDSYTGNWVSNTFYETKLPSWVEKFNGKKLPELYQSKSWEPIYPAFKYLKILNRENAGEKAWGKSSKDFPYPLEKLRNTDHPYQHLFQTPYGNTFLFDFAMNCLIEESLGKDEITDVLLINSSILREVEENFSPHSEELQDALFRLDQDLAYFLAFLDKEYGKENVLVFLTSTGVLPHRASFLKEQQLPGGELDPDRLVTLLKAYLNATYGPGEWIEAYTSENIYLNRELIHAANLSLKEVQEQSVSILEEMDAVYSANTASNLGNLEYLHGVNRSMQASYYPKRSGDVFLELKPNFTVKANPYRKVIRYAPANSYLYWWGWKMKRNKIIRPVSVCDIAPSLAEMLQMNAPNGSTGDVIQEIIP